MWPECCLCWSRGRWQPFEVAHSICQTPQQKQTAQQCFHQTDWLPQTFPVRSTSSFSAAFVLVNSCNYIQSVKCKSMGRHSLLGLQGPGTRGLAAIHNQEHVKIWLNIWPQYTESKNNTEHFNTFIHKCCHICLIQVFEHQLHHMLPVRAVGNALFCWEDHGVEVNLPHGRWAQYGLTIHSV